MRDDFSDHTVSLESPIVDALPVAPDDAVDLPRRPRALWIGEQGLGDEILFLQLGRDLIDAIGPDGQLYIAVEQRLVEMVQRTYPDMKW